MDLPTCPSCGQSVLDDEPGSCPFCGVAMDRSASPATALNPIASETKKKPVSDPQRQSRKGSGGKRSGDSEHPDEDPFEIAAPSQTGHAITCARKRTKSRPLRVICPMCDTRGYIPRSAVGRQVRCSNSDCLVPLFTAPDPDKAKNTASLSRMRDQAAVQEEQLARPTKKRSPLTMYGVLGGVLLVAGLALRSYLNQEPNVNRFKQPFVIPPIVAAEGNVETSSGAADPEISTDDVFDARALAQRLTDEMIRSAQMSTNRDKALCRRQTADAFLRLGDKKRYEMELDQLLVVSHQRNLDNDYYRIMPQARLYWNTAEQNNHTTTDALFAGMQSDAKTIPQIGLLATEAAVKWGAILVQRNASENVLRLVERLKVDDTVRSDVDGLYRSVWAALTVSATEAGQRSDSPIVTLIWTNPVATAIVVELSLHGQWDAAVSWAKHWTDESIRTELLAEIARQAVRQQASPSVINDVTEAASNAEVSRSRIQLILAQLSEERLQSAVIELKSDEKPVTREMLSMREVMRFRRPDLSADRERARTLMELARSAAAQRKNELTAAAIVSLFDCLRTTLPLTVAVREASQELDESADTLRTRLHRQLGTSDGDVSVFHNYRRGLDRLAVDVEQRRLYLIRLLCGVVEIDGGAGLRRALEKSEPLAAELMLDPLCQLIAGEAVLAGGSVPQLETVTEVRIPRGRRTRAQAEDSLAPIWLATVQASRKSYDQTLFRAFDSTRGLPGLRSCLQRRIAEERASDADVKILPAAAAVKSAPCREYSLWTAAAWLVRSGQVAEVEKWTGRRRLTATDRALAMSGIISSLELPDSPLENPE